MNPHKVLAVALLSTSMLMASCSSDAKPQPSSTSQSTSMQDPRGSVTTSWSVTNGTDIKSGTFDKGAQSAVETDVQEQLKASGQNLTPAKVKEFSSLQNINTSTNGVLKSITSEQGKNPTKPSASDDLSISPALNKEFEGYLASGQTQLANPAFTKPEDLNTDAKRLVSALVLPVNDKGNFTIVDNLEVSIKTVKQDMREVKIQHVDAQNEYYVPGKARVVYNVIVHSEVTGYVVTKGVAESKEQVFASDRPASLVMEFDGQQWIIVGAVNIY